jgi:hypothetical protein
MIIAFSFVTLLILLAERKVPYNDLALIASAAMPFTLKMFASPLIDAFHSN